MKEYFVQCKYRASMPMYTFRTAFSDLKVGERVLVADRNGFSMVEALRYISKPDFPCRNVLIREAQMERMDKKLNRCFQSEG